MIVLDTSFLIDFFKGVPETRALIDDRVYTITAISYHEIIAGVKRTHARKEEEFFRDFFSQTPVLDYTIAAAEESSSIAARLSASGKPVNVMDILIAGIALTNGATGIATADKDFGIIGDYTDLKACFYKDADRF
ncbi:PIN domain-containing protein [Methanomicrobium antiquum]|uniref:Ribonuclease VapC n=1 Tax=Methanomicrobium antiquum TaxID=487686 RepID=A0AAF0JM41_9EURY|nr:PIN domain-containing protein [Methanomicrobium antiquum]MDD3978197.1 PIN domain-containing protein [Methanomicrobium sp.]WFN37419.1 PIN domain-containing protein [Methanomicrobium antiquum]